MTIPRSIVQLAADTYTVCVLVLSTGAFLSVLIHGDLSQGSPLMRTAWSVVYAITLVCAVHRSNQVIPLIRANKPLMSLVLLTFISILWSVNRSVSIHAAVVLSFSALFALDMSTRYTFVRQIQLACIALALVIGMSILVDLIQPGLVPGADFEGTSWHGVFKNKNQLGKMATLGVAAFLTLPRRLRWVKAAAIACGILVALLSQSAGAVGYLVIIVGFSRWSSILKWRPKQRKLVIAASTIAALLLIYLVSRNVAEATATIGKDPTITGRTALWKLSLTAVEEHPILGYGFASFWDGASPRVNIIREALNWQQVPHAHNGYIDLLLELGLVGLGACTVAFGTMAQRAYLFFMNGPENYRKWPLTYLVFVFLYQLTESGFVSGDTILWILFCCVAFSLPPGKPRVIGTATRGSSQRLAA